MIDERILIFTNLLNKVPIGQVAQAFHKAESDIKSEFSYIIQKIKNYCYIKNIPPIMCDSLEEAQRNRHAIFPILKVIKLEKKPEFKITHQVFDGKLPGV